MHIAGGGGKAFMIPAYELLTAGNDSGLKESDELSLTNGY